MAGTTAHHGLFEAATLHVDDAGGPGRPVVLLRGWPLSGGADFELGLTAGAPQGCTASHPDEWNRALTAFLAT